MLPDLLATRRGRLAAFFTLYVAEGIPQGLATVAIAAQMRRQGVEPAEIGAFIAAFYLPWALKWAFGPFIDLFRSRRFGHRRGWIILLQLLMVATLIPVAALPLATALPVITAILFVHNVFGAMHDVAVDALAVSSLPPGERGLSNGIMLAGALLGHALGGAGVLFAMARGMPFPMAALAVACALLAVTLFIVLPMKEPPPPEAAARAPEGRWRTVRAELRAFAATSFDAFMGSRASFRALIFAMLPLGAIALSTPLATNLGVELGMDNDQLSAMRLGFSVTAGACLVVGGWLADRLGRRRMLALYVVGLSLPGLYLAWMLNAHGYVMPRSPATAAPLADLQLALWIATLSYAMFAGFATGTRLAVLMDMTTPRVAATQFTVYTSMLNFLAAFATGLQGLMIQAWGYPATLLVDALIGLPALLLLPSLVRGGTDDEGIDLRTRRTALVLGLACLSWLLVWPQQQMLGKSQPIVSSLYTVVFVASALFLLAGRETHNAAISRWPRATVWTALLLLAMHGRLWIGTLEALPWLHTAANALIVLVPAAAAALLIARGCPSQNWWRRPIL